MAEQDPTVVWTEGDQPEPVTPETPLVGLELRVLENWMENSPNVRKAHAQTPERVETAVRAVVWRTLVEELQLQARGMAPHESQEFTRPAMWKPPTFPTT